MGSPSPTVATLAQYMRIACESGAEAMQFTFTANYGALVSRTLAHRSNGLMSAWAQGFIRKWQDILQSPDYRRLACMIGGNLASVDDAQWVLLDQLVAVFQIGARVPRVLRSSMLEINHADPPMLTALQSILRLTSDTWLNRLRGLEPLAEGQEEQKEWVIGALIPTLIDEERKRRDDNLERRHYAQSNMAGMLESRCVPSFGYPIPADVQTLIGSFLHNIGTASQEHPVRLHRVPPRFGPAAPYADFPARATGSTGSTRKEPSAPAEEEEDDTQHRDKRGRVE